MYSILLRNSGLRRLASQFHCKSRFYTYSLYLIGEHDLCHKVLKGHVVNRISRPIYSNSRKGIVGSFYVLSQERNQNTVLNITLYYMISSRFTFWLLHIYNNKLIISKNWLYHYVYGHGNKLFMITRTVAPSNVSKVTTLTRSIFIYPHSPPPNPTINHNHLHSSTLQLVSANYQTSAANAQEYVFSSQSYVSLKRLSFSLLYSLRMMKDAQLFPYFTHQLFR